jgi:dihydroorotate dehydrogenase
MELNISSPNTEGIRVFQEPRRLEELLSVLQPFKEKPLFLKLPPYFDEGQRSRTMELVDLCLRHGLEGVTVANTRPVEDVRLAVGRGGLSGRPLFPDMLRMVREIRRHAGDGLVINACGGISSGHDALRALQAGANTVQLFTGFVYRGPGLMRQINGHILRYMERQGIPSLKAIPTEPVKG